jgi:hypothetical protein
VVEVDTRHHHGRYKYTFAGALACSETSAFVAFDPAAVLRQKRDGASSRYARLSGSVDFAINIVRAQTTKSSHVRPSVGNDTNANISCLK